MDTKLLKKFIKLLGERVSGDWIILGGTVLPLLQASSRYTKDIDLAPPLGATQKDTLTLMEIAESLHLPIEAINQAAGFFLYRIPNWQKEIILFHEGTKATIFRPSATLYLLLKIERMSETDLEDCLKMIEFSKRRGEALDRHRVISKIKSEIRSSQTHSKIERLKRLLSELGI